MLELIFSLPIIVFGGFFLLLFTVSAIREYCRSTRLAHEASAKGLEYSADDSAIEFDTTDLSLCRNGHSFAYSHCIHGHLGGREIHIVDLRFTVGKGRGRATVEQTLIILNVQEERFHTFILRPEGIFDKITDIFGHEDIDFPDHPEFSKRYHLLSNTPADTLRAVFPRTILDTLLRFKGLSIECQDGWIVFYRRYKVMPARQIMGFAEQFLEITNRMAQAVLAIPSP